MNLWKALGYTILYAFVSLGFVALLANLLNPICKYHKACELYSVTSVTCHVGPYDYCGKYKEERK